MKVLKEGREQSGWSTEATCTGAGNGDGGCGAVLLVEAGDVYETTSWARDEQTSYATFCCMACGVETDLTPKPRRKLWQGKRPVIHTEPS